jgi:hypothetical protein
MGAKARSVTVTVIVALAAVMSIGLVALLDASASSASTLSGCSWNSQVGNGGSSGYGSDTDAAYWSTSFFATPGAGIIVAGSFPQARYMSVTAYNSSGAADGVHLYDAQIQPVMGVNPFQSGVSGGTGTYQVQIVAQSPPANPAPNTLYVGQNNALVYVLYRVYDPTNVSDPTGGVGVPQVSETYNGTVTTTYGACTGATGSGPLSGPGSGLSSPLPGLGDLLPKLFGTTAAQAGTIAPADSPALSLKSPAEPTWSVANVTRYPNSDASYLEAAITQESGQVVVIQAQTPTFPDTNDGDPAWEPAQTRYWSFCVENAFTLTVPGCVADHSVVEPDGVATFAISTPADQPSNANAANGVNWISWGNAFDAFVVYRQILAAPSFGQSIAAIPSAGSVIAAMGSYYPQIAYCSVAEFESAGAAGCLAAAG